MKKLKPRVPGLSAAARKWRQRICSEFDLSDAPAQLLLDTAMRAYDRMQEAAALVELHGVCTLDRYRQVRANPAVAAERDARAAMISALKALNLDVQPNHERTGRL